MCVILSLGLSSDPFCLIHGKVFQVETSILGLSFLSLLLLPSPPFFHLCFSAFLSSSLKCFYPFIFFRKSSFVQKPFLLWIALNLSRYTGNRVSDSETVNNHIFWLYAIHLLWLFLICWSGEMINHLV